MLDQAWQVTSMLQALTRVAASYTHCLTDTEKESSTHDIEACQERDIRSVRSYTPPHRLPTPVDCPVSQTRDYTAKPVKVDRDMQTITTKGFRTLGLASTFVAGVEAQFYSVVAIIDSKDNKLLQAAGGLLLVGILFSASGAVTSLLAARWFELLSADEVVWLEHRWAYARGETRSPVPQHIDQKYRMRNWFVAKALSLPFYMILL
ncbi:hypothetical protein FRC10_011280 [Ceratobasidium sp. 414]|nr:hypothetical protein FRC10_011280 [Ceratobasidium sp. 414]